MLWASGRAESTLLTPMRHNASNLHKLTFLRNGKATIQKRTPADDVLSKNISFLLENLLKHYENSHLPTHGQGLI